MIDSHVHLNDPRLEIRFEEILEEFDVEHIECVLNIGDDLATSIKACNQANMSKKIFAAVGVHPSHSQTVNESVCLEFESLIKKYPKKVVAIGEIGLDYHYTDNIAQQATKEIQRFAFITQIELAHKFNLPIVVHCRDAFSDCIEILTNNKDKLHGGIIHCYSGSIESAKIFVDLGFHISFGGSITFKNNKTSADVIRSLPMNRILIETDCPYLTPEPLRGRCDNEPKFVGLVLAKMANILNMDVEEIERITSKNFYECFSL